NSTDDYDFFRYIGPDLVNHKSTILLKNVFFGKNFNFFLRLSPFGALKGQPNTAQGKRGSVGAERHPG
ncbi:MAG: hypothetical protein WCS95_09000, partial [Lentisphaeria bacterium]